MRSAWGVFALFIATGAAFLIWMFMPIQASQPAITLTGDPARGAYLARMSGCIACHTNEEKASGILAGGAALESPFGVFAAPNITLSPEHGLGRWSIDDFATAVRQGISPQGRPYYPAFPYQFYSGFSDQDIADLWSVLPRVPVVDAPDPATDIRFPFSIRAGLKPWQRLFGAPVAASPVSGQSADYNRGRFIVEGPAHCAACHTPRNMAGALKTQSWFAGTTLLPGGENAPAIDARSLSANGWTVADLAYALQTGITPQGDVLGGSMAEVILGGTQFLTEEDRRAMAIYLLAEP
ncbi:cytochrome c [Reinekea marinisedimentorum]|uniref:Mono/diheme cytochrome c family protein n=1 Tax=Reinekea marinisedimentorum TaxID=230495 RepID=A0A4R3HX66_9GAMM|nr:cytochrome c [Reinekea marinisedimentorum]TCS36765.1 mono/diheme cytochrome c family protein [Reinekea marinisedimentorum]